MRTEPRERGRVRSVPAADEVFGQLEDWIDAKLGEAALNKALAAGTLPYDAVAKELGLQAIRR